MLKEFDRKLKIIENRELLRLSNKVYINVLDIKVPIWTKQLHDSMEDTKMIDGKATVLFVDHTFNKYYKQSPLKRYAKYVLGEGSKKLPHGIAPEIIEFLEENGIEYKVEYI